MPISIDLSVVDHTMYATATWRALCSDARIVFPREPLNEDIPIHTLFRDVRRRCVRAINLNRDHQEIVFRDHDARRRRIGMEE